jgi:branched-chain amino acid transport system permease protein
MRGGHTVVDPSQIADPIITGLLRGGLYALMALGLALVFGVMNIPNFAHGDFYMVGAYLAFFSFTAFGLGPILSIIVAMFGAFILGVLVEKGVFYTLRKRSKKNWVMNTFLLTLGISIVLQNSVKMLFGANYRGVTAFWPGTMQIGSINVSIDRIVGFLIAIIAIAGFWVFLSKTKVGRSIRAVSQDETGSQLVGVNLNWIHTLTFGLSCAVAALAGASLLSITPASPGMGLTPLYKSWFVCILVGMGNVGASIWGGLLLGILETFAYMQFGAGWQDAISLAVIILILLFKPSGLFAKKGVKSALE